jgi:endonuclease/exonuclease/phosphatase family metal-dependent hydrolase
MQPFRTLRRSPMAATLLWGLLCLCFIQLLTDFVAALYAVGLMGLNIPPEIACVLFLFAPLALVFWRRPVGARALNWVGAVALVCRAVEPLLATHERLFVTGLGVAGFLVLFAGWLSVADAPEDRELGRGLALGTGFAILLRAAGNGIDLSTLGMFKAIGWLLALAAGALLFLRAAPTVSGAAAAHPEHAKPTEAFWRVAGLSVGIVAAFTMLYFGFAAPNVIARWVEAPFLPVLLLAFLALAGFAWLSNAVERLSARTVVLWNLAFVLALVLTIGVQQINFPPDAQAFPLDAPAGSPWQVAPLAVMLLLFPVICLDLRLFYRAARRLRPTPRAAGAGFGLASLFLLVLIFAHVFTTVYDYIPVVGPLFRDRFWLVYLLAGAGLVLPLGLVGWKTIRTDPVREGPGSANLAAGVLAACAVLGLALAASGEFAPLPPARADHSLRVLTYNIQQGYDAAGQKNITGQLRLMRQADADIIGLQESDTNRIAGGNDDVVGFLASQLHMYAYYGPSPVTGTFGIALLSRLPIQNPHTFFMASTGEQTAGIGAQITQAGRTFNVCVTHLGNDGALVQQEGVLREMQGQDNLVMMGDFNFDARSPSYQRTVASLADAWWMRWPQGTDNQGFTAAEEIDHIFVSPTATVTDIHYLTGPESDHPALFVQIGW